MSYLFVFCDVTGQPGLQSEKTSLHEKSKKKSKETLLSHAPDGFMLPHVKGAEGEEPTAPACALVLVLSLRFIPQPTPTSPHTK